MAGKVVLGQHVGRFGNEIRIMAVRVHNVLANNTWPAKLPGFWT